MSNKLAFAGRSGARRFRNLLPSDSPAPLFARPEDHFDAADIPGLRFCSHRAAVARRALGASIIMSGDVPAQVPDAVIAELRSREHNGLNRAANEAATGLTDRLSARRARAHSHRRLPRLFRTVRKPTGARPDLHSDDAVRRPTASRVRGWRHR